ncbi:glycosyltransferase family 2 protein [Nonomuraea cavernae]|uniref:Glycosyl transferase n=1 Tax=Nonomuraea cavernae TaxID=2045107 RepID=A0A918DRN0_9ACTN|nr:glycosyltransferase family 2 protein [Nonomuraea cavernae]MCA2190381.1 glycosyltransferase family 2 protein [Nonomuraea cavernae]GGO80816.1 glycosyl transferase [Nonomuraea cavernae]
MTTGLTVLVPCFNEGAQVEAAYHELVAELKEIGELEILFVDDGSSDDSLERIRRLAETDPRVRYLSFTRNFGIDAVMAAGFRYASRPWTVQCDADLQVPPAEIWSLLAKAAEGYDVVFGERIGRRDPLVRRAGSAGLHWAARRIFGIGMPRGASTFRLVRTGLARTITDLRLPWFIPAVPLVGARYTATPVAHRPRTAGRSKLRLARLAAHSFELFFGFSLRPLVALYAAGALGGALALLLSALGYLGVAGGTALPATQLLLTGVTLAALAVLGRYLHRLLRESDRLRTYYVRDANVPLLPEDTLTGGLPGPPPPTRTAPDRL